MTLATLKELEKRLSEASGPDREIDFRIAALTDEQMAADLRIADGLTYSSNGEFVLTSKRSDGKLGRGFYGDHMVPQFTASLDAAIALAERVLPGWAIQLGLAGSRDGEWHWNARVIDPAEPGVEGEDPKVFYGTKDDKSGALALCLAVVRALKEGK